MTKGITSMLVLLFVFGVATSAVAQEEMTREEYASRLADYTGREAKAKTNIVGLDASISDLKVQISGAQKQIDEMNARILAAIGSTKAEVRAFGQQLDGLLRQLEGLAALAPEELQRRRGELKEAGAMLGELRMSKISALPEMAAKIDRAQRLLDELWMRAPDSITYEVVTGDHLWGISSKTEVYDDPYMWPRLYRANRDQIKDPDMIYPNQVLNVPIAIGESQYLVTSGDFLSSIASAVYNDPTMWHKIYKANAEQIVEPSLIFPAQVLEIPSN